VHVIQTLRKDMALEYTQRIRVGIATGATELQTAARDFADYIQGETLATDLRPEPLAGVASSQAKVGDYPCELFIASQK
jgi:hypothetical protein